MDTFCIGLDEFDSNIRTIWQNLQKEEEFCDMTLACEGKVIQTHKVIISAISPILRNILRLNTNKYPCIYLRGVKFKELENLLNFIYQGEVCIEEEDINSFLEVGKDLQIKGMASVQMQNSKSESSPMDPTENMETVKIVFSDDLSMETAENIVKIETEDTIMEPSTESGSSVVYPVKSRVCPQIYRKILPKPVTNDGDLSLDAPENIMKVETEDTIIEPSSVVDPSGNDSIKSSRVWNSIKIRPGAVKKVQSKVRPIDNAIKKVQSKTIVDSAGTEFRCEICSNVYSTLGSLNTHKAAIHEWKKTDFSCDICSKVYSSRAPLYAHKAAAHEGVAYPCERCGKEFSQRGNLLRHINAVHENIRSQCELCEKSFNDISALRGHIKTKHEGVRYQCEQCGKDFGTKAALNKHIELVHDEYFK